MLMLFLSLLNFYCRVDVIKLRSFLPNSVVKNFFVPFRSRGFKSRKVTSFGRRNLLSSRQRKARGLSEVTSLLTKVKKRKITGLLVLKRKRRVFLKKKVDRVFKNIREGGKVSRGIIRKGSFYSPYIWVSYQRGEIIYGGKPDFESEVYYPFSLDLDNVIGRYRGSY